MIDKIEEACRYISSRTEVTPKVGIILGTGLGALVDEIEIKDSFSYVDLPHFPESTVEGHKGRLIMGLLSNVPVVVMQGRFHYYEGYSMPEITFPVRVMKMLGIEALFISNAAGALNQNYEISDLMIISDHINLLPENPLRGPNLDSLGPRFPDMSEPYDRELITKARQIAEDEEIRYSVGVYAVVQGPNLETDAEYKYLHTIGGDAIGMSTVPENIVARHMGIPCFAISVITDKWIPGQLEEVTIEKVIAAAKTAEPGMTRIIMELVKSV